MTPTDHTSEEEKEEKERKKKKSVGNGGYIRRGDKSS